MNATVMYKDVENEMNIFGWKSGKCTAKKRSGKIIAGALIYVSIDAILNKVIVL
jgi:hypothetical protein